jgi:Ino eighty subunit 1
VHSSSTGVTLKKADAELLSRVDVQYDLLTYLFDDKTEVFTDHARLYNPELKRPVFPRVTFRQLYLTALHESVKLSGVIKDRMKTDTEFGLEFAKIALLVNVGRINTTMACTFVFEVLDTR